MKKCFAIFVFAVLIFCSCISQTEEFSSIILDMDMMSYVKFPHYDANTIPVPVYTKEDLNSIILFHLSFNQKYVPVNDRSNVEENDYLLLSLEISIGQQIILKTDQFHYLMYSGDFTDDFDEAVLVMNVGEKSEFTIRFPEDFNSVAFAGNDVDFSVELLGIERDIGIEDTEWIEYYYECNNMEEVYYTVEQQAVHKAVFEQIYEFVCENSIIRSMPSELKSYIMNAEGYNREIREQITYEIMLMKAICEYEKYAITAEKYEEAVRVLAKAEGMTVEEFKNQIPEIDICYQIFYDMAVEAVNQ